MTECLDFWKFQIKSRLLDEGNAADIRNMWEAEQRTQGSRSRFRMKIAKENDGIRIQKQRFTKDETGQK